MTDDTIRIFLVDDQPLIRSGLRMVLSSQPDLEVVGEAGDGADALRQLKQTACDIVLMDVRMPGIDGIETTRRLLDTSNPEREGRSLRVVVLTTFDLDEHALAALRAGASGFLLKDTRPETLIEAVRTIYRGDAVIAPSTTRRLLAALTPVDQDRAREERGRDAVRLISTLTSREREVFTLVSEGRSNPEIAAHLFISDATVKTHISKVLAKLGARDRVQLVITAYDAGLVPTNRSQVDGTRIH